MKRESPLVRQWTLLRMLGDRHAGATVREIAREMGVNDKMIRRDLVTFRSVGFPLEEIVEAFGRKRWRLDPKEDPARPGFHVRRGGGPLSWSPLPGTAGRKAKRCQTGLAQQGNPRPSPRRPDLPQSQGRT